VAQRGTLNEEVAEADFLILSYFFIKVSTEVQDRQDYLGKIDWAYFFANK
jgi:hypothetical protein